MITEDQLAISWFQDTGWGYAHGLVTRLLKKYKYPPDGQNDRCFGGQAGGGAGGGVGELIPQA